MLIFTLKVHLERLGLCSLSSIDGNIRNSSSSLTEFNIDNKNSKVEVIGNKERFKAQVHLCYTWMETWRALNSSEYDMAVVEMNIIQHYTEFIKTAGKHGGSDELALTGKLEIK